MNTLHACRKGELKLGFYNKKKLEEKIEILVTETSCVWMSSKAKVARTDHCRRVLICQTDR
jgi:hypothetical protein